MTKYKKRITVQGVVYNSIDEAADKYKINRWLFNRRVYCGWTGEQASEIILRRVSKSDVALVIGDKKYPSIKAASREFGISPTTIADRIKSGMSAIEAVTKPIDRTGRGLKRAVVIEGVLYSSLTDAAKKYGVKLVTLSYKLNKGLTPEQAVGLEKKDD